MDERILIGQEDSILILILICLKQMIYNYLWPFENLWNHLKAFYVAHQNVFGAEAEHL
jgi:hypothetical protein